MWALLDKLVMDDQLIIDRMCEMCHLNYSDKIYLLDYSVLEGTESTGNMGIDVWCRGTLGMRQVADIVTINHLEKILK